MKFIVLCVCEKTDERKTHLKFKLGISKIKWLLFPLPM